MLDKEKEDINIRFVRSLIGIHHSESGASNGICAANSSLINTLNWPRHKGREGPGMILDVNENKRKEREKKSLFVGDDSEGIRKRQK